MFTTDVRVASIDSLGNIKTVSDKIPPISELIELNNAWVQAMMDTSPDMSYFVVASLNWDFIEIYTADSIRMFRGPIFENTQYKSKWGKRPISEFDETTFASLHVDEGLFSLGLSRLEYIKAKNLIIDNIDTILVFSEKGEPLYRISLPTPAFNFDIDYSTGSIIVFENPEKPILKRYHIDFPDHLVPPQMSAEPLGTTLASDS